MKVSYIRVSSSDQNTQRQEEAMMEHGVEKLFIDKLSGKDINRPELHRMLDFVRKGDVVLVESFSRLARNTKDLLEIVEQLKFKEVEFISLKEKIDTSTAAGQFMLTVFAAIAELERDYIRQRQKEGIEIAKKNGKYKGRKRIVNDSFEKIYKMWKSGSITATKAMTMLGMKRNTFYRRVHEYEIK